MIILTYDIKDDHLRSNFSKFILKYGRRLQYSVYEVDNSQRVLDIVIAEIKNTFEKQFKQCDSVIIFKISSKDILRFGYAKNEEQDLLIY